MTTVQIETVVKPLLAVKAAVDSTPENKQVLKKVDEAIAILDRLNREETSTSKGLPLGGSTNRTSFEVNEKTKNLFEMWGLGR